MSRRSRNRRWKAILYAWPLVLLLLAAAGAQASVASVPPSDPAAAAPDALPDPPRQNDPWTPPAASLPPDMVAATRTLFRRGMADPRGGDYREVTVQASGFQPGATYPARVHGWVLPSRPGGSRAFAVCWDGQVYPAASIGAPADLKADAAAMARDGSSNGNGGRPDSAAVSPTSFAPLKACLLVRLGEARLAEQVWATQPTQTRSGDPTLRLAADWTWGLFRRVLDARAQGNDSLALSLLRRLARIRASIEGAAAERHLPLPAGPGFDQRPVSPSYLPTLNILPELLADEERRARTPAHTPALLAGEKGFADRSAYIAALVGDLDQVSPHGWSSATGPSVDGDPIVAALVAQGDDAVEPLIHAVATDTHLIRLVEVEPFQHQITAARASRIAFTAAVMILQFSVFGDGRYRENDPARSAAALQRYWDKYKGMPLAERWYGTLANDRATPAQWQEAADAIVRPANVTLLGSGATVRVSSQPGAVIPLRGEPLRARFGPAVSRLMARRMSQIAARDRVHPWVGPFNAHDAVSMALDAARWDARASLPALRRYDDDLRSLPTTGYFSDPISAGDESAVTLARVRAGDTRALSDYAAWLLSDPTPAASSVGAFEPLWRFPRDPATAASSARLFGGPSPVWLPGRKDNDGSTLGTLLESPLLGLPAFRCHFLAALGDRTALGRLKVDERGGWSSDVPGLYGSGSQLDEDTTLNPSRPKMAWTLTARRCDVYAWHLSHLGGMPQFAFYWPQPKRDTAIAQAADRLRRLGARFEYRPDLDRVWGQDAKYTHAAGLDYLWDTYDSPRAHLAFPRLGRPATPAEAARGEAVFALTGPGARRVWPLPRWPLSALGKPATDSRQGGLVWQAEEVRRGGRWQRFYGFVGPHDIARVPAEQIEFPPDRPYTWQSFSPTLDAKASPPGDIYRLPVGRPLPVTLTLRSRSGVDQSIPAEWQRTRADGPAVRGDLRLCLSYSPRPILAAMDGPEADLRAWTPLPPIRTASFTPSPAMRLLTPTQEAEVLRLNLRDWFDLSRPGFYRLDFKTEGKRATRKGERTVSLWFELTE